MTEGARVETGSPARSAGEVAISVRGLEKRYGERSVLGGVTFEVRRGEVVALLGPNGAGKTTTAEIVEGYRRGDGGAVSVLGRDPWRASVEHRARVGLMLQAGGIDPRMRAAETLGLYSRFFAAPLDPAALLADVGLAHVARTPYRRLSGGERQRLALALALVGRPEVLVLDEPTAGMDPEAKASTRSLIAGLRSDGAAVLVTTHELADVERLADRVVVLAQGVVVAAGTPSEILAGASAQLRVRFAAPLSDGRRGGLETALRGVNGDARLVLDAPAGHYHVEGAEPSPSLVAALASWCEAEGAVIAELRTEGATLEERYLELAGESVMP